MDRASASEAGNMGSTPVGRNFFLLKRKKAPGLEEAFAYKISYACFLG